MLSHRINKELKEEIKSYRRHIFELQDKIKELLCKGTFE